MLHLGFTSLARDATAAAVTETRYPLRGQVNVPGRPTETEKAIEYYKERLISSVKMGDSRGEGTTFGNLGAALIDLGRLEDAESYLLQSLDLTQKSGNWRREAIDYWDLGVVYYSRGEIPMAIEYMQHWVDYEIEIEHPDAERHTGIVEKLKEIPANF